MRGNNLKKRIVMMFFGKATDSKNRREIFFKVVWFVLEFSSIT